MDITLTSTSQPKGLEAHQFNARTMHRIILGRNPLKKHLVLIIELV
jgi:hypothetical protein